MMFGALPPWVMIPWIRASALIGLQGQGRPHRGGSSEGGTRGVAESGKGVVFGQEGNGGPLGRGAGSGKGGVQSRHGSLDGEAVLLHRPAKSLDRLVRLKGQFGIGMGG